MKNANKCPAPPLGAFTLVELVISAAIMVVIVLGLLAHLKRDTANFESHTRAVGLEVAAQDVIRRLEEDLAFARGESPSTVLTEDLTDTATNFAEVGSTVGFPDIGTLIIDRGEDEEERITYDSILGTSFENLARGQCSDGADHVTGDEVRWVATAEPIADQVAPDPDDWDGQSRELDGPLFFRGEGTGFVFRSLTDPAGGTDFIDGGELRWGADVDGQPTLDGWSALYFAPIWTLSEAQVGNDINRDGDRVDVFDVGQIRARNWNAQDPTQASEIGISPRNVLQEVCAWGSDLDGDGFADPLFLWRPDSGQLHVRLFTVAQPRTGPPIVRSAESVIFLRNHLTTPD